MKRVRSAVVFFSQKSVLVIALLFGLSLAQGQIHAATLTVTNLNDSGSGSLRQAIADANSGDTINFAVTGTITLTSGQLHVDKNLTIAGPGAQNLAISGNNAFRVFLIFKDFRSAPITVTISDLTIRNGSVTNDNGGCILAISSNLNIANSTIKDGSASNGGVGGGGIGIEAGLLNIVKSTISGNSADVGGGIQASGSDVHLINSTVSGNSAALAGGGILIGGNEISPFVELDLSFCTLSGNTNGAIASDGVVKIKNTIVANSLSGDNCRNFNNIPVQSFGTNFSTDGSCQGATQVTPAQLNLGPLADNGGPTQTHALGSGSVAIDAVSDCTDLNFVPVTTDQRGVSRPQGLACDSGSFEKAVVLTPQEQIANLQNAVGALPGLNQGQKNSLLVKLNAAAQQLAKGNKTPAINQLQAFINEVNALVQSGRLSPLQGQTLRDAANAIISQLA